ncbi:MAG: TIGR02281 family clan AA aspartic protease, partial [Novosphingobium sp.]
ARALTLTRNESGQFSLNVAVNGSDVEFLVDTGADMVALTEADAEALGLLPDEEEFQPSMRTASGVGYGAQITIDEIEIGGKKLHDIEAVVVRDLGTNLLGQTVLRRLRSVELKGDKMVIRAR